MAKSEYKNKSEAELERIIESSSGTNPASIRSLWELQRRRSKPHWTVTPGFWAIIITMIFAAISAWPVIQGWFQAGSTVGKSSTVQSPQLQSKPGLSSESKTELSPSTSSNHRLENDREDATSQPT